MNGQLHAVVPKLRRILDPMRGDENDGQLLEAFASRRDEDAFAVLVRRHGPRILTLCRRIAGDGAEDAFQVTFLVLARKARSLPRRPSVPKTPRTDRVSSGLAVRRIERKWHASRSH